MVIRLFGPLVFVACLLPLRANADGVKVKNRIDLDQLLAKSEVIVTATIRAIHPAWATREAYGQQRKYVASFHFKVSFERWLKGQHESLSQWVSLRGDPIPGKWMLIEEAYDSHFSPHDAKVGQRVILFLPRQGSSTWAAEAGESRPEIPAKEIEDIALLPKVQEALAESRARSAKDPL